MALYTMADNNIDITASRDGAMYNSFAGNLSYVIGGIGEELECTYNGFEVTLGTGEAVICGRHVTELLEEGTATTLTVGASETGYIVLRVDLSKPAGMEAYLYNTPTLTQGNLNNGDIICDLPLYNYVANTSGISTFKSARTILTTPLDNKVSKSGDIMSGGLTIKGSAAEKPLRVRGVNGISADGATDDFLYLNYGSNKQVKLGTAAAYNISEDGSRYTGKAQNVYGVIAAENGGHGKTTLNAGMQALINSLAEASATIYDDTWIVTAGVTADALTTFYRRKASGIMAYIRSKLLGYETGNGTLNTNYIKTGGKAIWYKQTLGNQAICTVMLDVEFKAAVSSDNIAIIASALPEPIGGGFIFPIASGGATNGTPKVNFDAGVAKPWYCGNASGHWFGAFTYLCKK